MIKKFLKEYHNFNKEYCQLNLPKKISISINGFSLFFLAVVFIPILIFLTTAFKVYNIFRMSFIVILLLSVFVFLIFYCYNEVISIKYLRSFYNEDKEKFINSLKEINLEIDVDDIIEKIINVNLKKYWLYLLIKSVFICSICLMIFYLILRKLFR